MKVAILADFPLHVIPEFGEKYIPNGHFATWLPQLAQAFGEYPDLEVHWLTVHRLIDAPQQARWKGQTFHVFPAKSPGRALRLFAEDRKTINAYLAQIQPDLVHGWGTEDVYALAAATSGLPNIVSMQGILSHYVFQTRMAPRSYLQALIEMYVFYKADCITTESAWGRQVILRRNPRTDVELVEYGVQNHFLETPWQPDPQKPVAIFVGSIVPRKGIQDAVEAFRDPALAQAELWVVGDGGPWAANLQASAPANVRWLGRLDSMETARLLGRAWCLVLPTRADTSPNVVKEARVIGLPVVSTPCGGQVSYIEHGKNGFLVEPGDIRSLAESLGQLLSDFDRTAAMGRFHHEEQRYLLDPRRTAEGFFDLYKKRLSPRGESL